MAAIYDDVSTGGRSLLVLTNVLMGMKLLCLVPSFLSLQLRSRGYSFDLAHTCQLLHSAVLRYTLTAQRSTFYLSVISHHCKSTECSRPTEAAAQASTLKIQYHHLSVTSKTFAEPMLWHLPAEATDSSLQNNHGLTKVSSSATHAGRLG